MATADVLADADEADNGDIDRRARRRPPTVFGLLVIGFTLITLIPTAILAWEVYRGAWDNAWREVTEKHQLLATNLASPISIYVNDHRDMMSHLSGQLSVEFSAKQSSANAAERRDVILKSALHTLRGFRSLTLVAPSGTPEVLAYRDLALAPESGFFATEACFLHTRESFQPTMSPLKPHPTTGTPTIIMSHPVLDEVGTLRGVLLGELRVDRVEQLRDSVRFGRKGHSAIVDQTGKVLAHGNAEWVAEMRDLSGLGVVQLMLEGKTGVTEFHSPFLKKDMIAGYTSVPELGWGIMVPQPREEIEEQVWALVSRHFAWAGLCSLLALLVAVWFARWITRPINQLAAAANMLKKEPDSRRVPSMPAVAPREVQQLGASFRALLSDLQKSRADVDALNRKLRRRVDRSTEKLKRANANLADLARSDHLTKLNNRLYFEYALKRVVEQRDRRRGPHALLTLDLDRFKVVNDSCGHIAGDELLKRIATLLREMVRGDDVIARLGGDEFAVLLRTCSQTEAMTVAENIRDSLADMRFRWEGRAFDVSASIGVVMVTPGESDLDTVLQAADASCLDAKSRGKDQVVLYEIDDANHSTRIRESRWIARLTDAIEQDKFVLYYQPIVPVNKLTRGHHCEVLLRLRQDDGTTLGPESFLPPAERFQLMPRVDRWVTGKVIEWLASDASEDINAEVILVNLSAQSLTDDRFADFVTDKLTETGVSGKRLCFEVTETAAIVSMSRANDLMSRLRDLGCRFALDDFGSGMSSFDYLTHLPVQVLKIDGSFVERIVDSEAHRAIVRSMNDIGHAMDMVTIAESVSNPEILSVLRTMGVNYAQGYELGHPRPLIVENNLRLVHSNETIQASTG